MPPIDSSWYSTLKERGITRRQFVAFCGAMASMMLLPPEASKKIAYALASQPKPTLVWLELQDCAGNSESMLRSPHPTVTDVVLDTVSWNYHELIMAAAGKQAEDNRDSVVKDLKGQYIAVVEGAIPLANGGVYCTIGGRTALDIATEVCTNAALCIAVGSCAFDGGPQRSSPNPTGAVGLAEAVPGAKVVNLGGCPHNPANTAALLVYYLTYNRLPELDQFRRPTFMHGQLIHNQCQRRAHFDAGQFVEQWGDEGHRLGYCLYKMGCKGPQGTWNCPQVRWNNHTSWPIQSGENCFACASHRFWDTMSPFYQRLPDIPGVAGWDVTAGQIGLGLTALTAAGFAAHGAASIVRARARKKRTGLTGQEGHVEEHPATGQTPEDITPAQVEEHPTTEEGTPDGTNRG